MKKIIYIMGIWSLISGCFIGKTKKVAESVNADTPESIYDIRIKTLDGKGEIKFSDFKGKYIVVVNTASECGYTYQYKNLQEFYTRYADSNVVIIGCPCNQFGKQEPGSAAEIEKFCQENYGVSFPMTEKIDVKGANQHPLYTWLTHKKYNGAEDFEVKWNFNKFIVSREGKLLYFFGSGTKPQDPEFMKSLNLSLH